MNRGVLAIIAIVIVIGAIGAYFAMSKTSSSHQITTTQTSSIASITTSTSTTSTSTSTSSSTSASSSNTTTPEIYFYKYNTTFYAFVFPPNETAFDNLTWGQLIKAFEYHYPINYPEYNEYANIIILGIYVNGQFYSTFFDKPPYQYVVNNTVFAIGPSTPPQPSVYQAEVVINVYIPGFVNSPFNVTVTTEVVYK